ncbi:DUF2845 domain-containing protein [Caldimonas tepidiphila]|uniref:DUF2845 domain-containing protein n=1 Tax=Caldimonas tepidiphila TaxID=2315841 RepID=UPI001300A048|nr:DUF2845 domain-containing protein [Caldimonas tepidiphila]
MKFALSLLGALVLGLGAAWPQPAAAESLRCGRGIADIGDTRLSVLYKCGEPLMRDSYCAPVYQGPVYPGAPLPPAVLGLPCQPVDEWLYDRGPGNLMATVRFQSGAVQSIRYGRVPQ